MSTASSTAFLLWAILSVLFQIFLVYHLWCYDKFRCLHWSSGRQPGNFKRVMTYSYLGSVPLFVLFSVATTVIKFKEGFLVTPDHRIIPMPLDLYRPDTKRWIIPLDFVFSIAWALELVTHLEELAFWLYLLHQNPEKEEWFSSWEYRFWYLCSLVAILGMPLTVLITRHDVMTCDAYIFLVGASGSSLTTISFLYVLWRFPSFIRHVKAEGADPSVVVRLATFYQLNLARVIFRFLFTVPLTVLAVDGIAGSKHPVNRNPFWADFLLMIAGIGCFVSTSITLLIFFPRSIVNEAGYRPKVLTPLPGSPKSPMISPPPLSPSFTPSHRPSRLLSPALSFSATSAIHDTDEWEEDDPIPTEDASYPDLGQAPPYAQHSHALRYLHEQAAYQRHPFPHSLSSPHILSPPASPQQIRIAISPNPHARYSRRLSVVEVERVGSPGTGTTVIGTDGSYCAGAGAGAGGRHDGRAHRVRRSQTVQGVPRPVSSSLHPYVMTFTSPIDLVDIQGPCELPRGSI